MASVKRSCFRQSQCIPVGKDAPNPPTFGSPFLSFRITIFDMDPDVLAGQMVFPLQISGLGGPCGPFAGV